MRTRHYLQTRLVGMAAAAALIVPVVLTAQASVSTDTRATTVDTTDRGYVELLTRAHNDEIEAGRNALTGTQDPKVRGFAQKLVDDHTKALEKLNPIATRLGVSTMASTMPADHSMNRDSTLPKPEEGMGAMGDSAKMRPAPGDSMAPPPADAARPSPKSPVSDKQFIDAMVVNHQQLLGKLPEEGRGIKDKELRSYVGEVRKSVQRHYTMARDIQTKMGGREK